MKVPDLDVEKLKENALISIRLGIEDFQRSQLPIEQGGDTARTLSSMRNLFAGVLLLFKYKIALCADDPQDAASLIFKPPEVLPESDGNGGVSWKPQGNFKSTTIDVDTIKKRFESFDIEVDWEVIEKLQKCRNHLEHLHPANTYGELASFVAELFPILRDFILTQLNEQPAELLGNSWPIMLQHHAFFMDNKKNCEEAWKEVGIPELMEDWLDSCQCEQCGSSLLGPNQEDLEKGLFVKFDGDIFHYACLFCGYSSLIKPLLLKALDDAYPYDPRGGDEAPIETCYVCKHDAFLNDEQQCLWCGEELQFKECTACYELLRQDDQGNNGLCSYHYYQYEKTMSED